jgi:hypothetical protein
VADDSGEGRMSRALLICYMILAVAFAAAVLICYKIACLAVTLISGLFGG